MLAHLSSRDAAALDTLALLVLCAGVVVVLIFLALLIRVFSRKRDDK